MPLQLLFAISTICLRARRVINFSRKYFFSLLFITILKLLPIFMMNIFISKAINQMDEMLNILTTYDSFESKFLYPETYMQLSCHRFTLFWLISRLRKFPLFDINQLFLSSNPIIDNNILPIRKMTHEWNKLVNGNMSPNKTNSREETLTKNQLIRKLNFAIFNLFWN